MAGNNFDFDWTNTLKPIGDLEDYKKWMPNQELYKTTGSVSDFSGPEKALELDLDAPSFASKGGKAAADSLKIGKDGAVGAKGMFADPEMLKGLQSSLSLFMAGWGLASGKGLLRKR